MMKRPPKNCKQSENFNPRGMDGLRRHIERVCREAVASQTSKQILLLSLWAFDKNFLRVFSHVSGGWTDHGRHGNRPLLDPLSE
jgi:hypothetical protein